VQIHRVISNAVHHRQDKRSPVSNDADMRDSTDAKDFEHRGAVVLSSFGIPPYSGSSARRLGVRVFASHHKNVGRQSPATTNNLKIARITSRACDVVFGLVRHRSSGRCTPLTLHRQYRTCTRSYRSALRPLLLIERNTSRILHASLTRVHPSFDHMESIKRWSSSKSQHSRSLSSCTR
jgi:hypothetical protein